MRGPQARMMSAAEFPWLPARIFCDRLMQQRPASPRAIASCRDSFELRVRYALRA